MQATQITFLRRDGHGIAGTYTNAEHHAQNVQPIVAALEPFGALLGFAEWKQGHNVHVFIANDDRKFTLRAFIKDGQYAGIRLSARLSRSQELRLFDITSVAEVPMMVQMMANLATPKLGDDTPLM